MAFHRGPKIVTDGLVLYVDAANPKSYTSGSTTTRSLTGTITGSLVNGVGYTSGSYGGWTFDGSNDYIQTQTGIITSVSSFTVDMVIKYNSSNPIYGGLFGYGKSPDTNANFGFLLHATAGGFYSLLSDGTNRSSSAIISSMQNNKLYNVVYTFQSNGNTSAYLNGNLVQSSAAPVGFTTLNVNSSFYISLGMDVRYSPASANRHYLGEIYNCKLYNKILTAAEILQNYNATKSRFGL